MAKSSGNQWESIGMLWNSILPPLPTPLLPTAIVMPRTCFHWYLYQHPNLEPHSSHLHSFISGIPILEKFVTHVLRLSHCPANTVHHCTPSSNTPFTGRTSSANTSPHQLLLQHTNPEGSKATFHLHAGPAAKCPAETHHPKWLFSREIPVLKSQIAY